MAWAVLFAFALSLGLQGQVATAASINMRSHAAMTMASMDDSMPADCPSQNTDDRTNCIAACASFAGMLFEPASLAVRRSCHVVQDEQMPSLATRTIPPEPHPPRPSALI